MEAMPHLVEMQKKYADKGLVVVAVSVDPWDKKDLVAQANKFLRKLEPPFRCFLLNESEEFIEKKFDFVFPPCYYVFDRRGKWVRFRSTDYNDGIPYGEMDKVIVQMLDDK
jgi:hypothetical protein